jgi:Mor family transcriptional regulator
MAETANDQAILDRLNGDFRRVAELIGLDNALRISAEFGGLWISVPKLDSLKREVRDRVIRETYDKAQKTQKTHVVRSLAREHDLTARQIYNILGVQPADDAELTLPLFFTETQSVK